MSWPVALVPACYVLIDPHARFVPQRASASPGFDALPWTLGCILHTFGGFGTEAALLTNALSQALVAF